MQPYKHQQDVINETIHKLGVNKSVLVQASTGFGKTVLSAFLIQKLIKHNKRVLFLADSEDLIYQASGKFSKIGIAHECIFSKVKKPKHHSSCYISMVETSNNRLKKDNQFYRDIDVIISDECHVLVHQKIYDYFPSSKIIGLTATPVVLKRITYFKCQTCKTDYENLTNCCGDEVMEYSRPFAMSEIYDDIVVSKGIDWLINNGFLVRENTIVKRNINLDKLETDSSGEYTNKSQNKVFTDANSIDSLVNDYLQLCKGKKTLLFTPSTKVNKIIVEKLLNKGVDVKSYDSVNNKPNERKACIDWFKSNRDTVLVNTGCFTKGLDVTDIECIILYRATNSLSLFIQIVGRGARTTDKIYKDSFLFIDYGGNVDKHNQFSDPTRDWKSIFFNGIGKPKAKRETLEVVTQCDNCGCLYSKSETVCPNCGTQPKPKKKKVPKGGKYELVPLQDMPLPSGNKIVEYTKRNNEGTSFAFKIVTNQILDLFKFYNVDKNLYLSTLKSGELDRKITNLVQKCYFVIIRSNLHGKNRRLKSIIDNVKLKLSKYYEKTD